MDRVMNLAHHVESYRFWDIVTQWARESLQCQRTAPLR